MKLNKIRLLLLLIIAPAIGLSQDFSDKYTVDNYGGINQDGAVLNNVIFECKVSNTYKWDNSDGASKTDKLWSIQGSIVLDGQLNSSGYAYKGIIYSYKDYSGNSPKIIPPSSITARVVLVNGLSKSEKFTMYSGANFDSSGGEKSTPHRLEDYQISNVQITSSRDEVTERTIQDFLDYKERQNKPNSTNNQSSNSNNNNNNNNNRSNIEPSSTSRTNNENSDSGTINRNQSNENRLDNLIDTHNKQDENLNQFGNELRNTVTDIFNQPKSQAQIAREKAREAEESRRQKAIDEARQKKIDSISYTHLKTAKNAQREKMIAIAARNEKVRKQEWEDNKGYDSKTVNEAKEMLNLILENPSKEKLQDYLKIDKYASQHRKVSNYIKFWDVKNFKLYDWDDTDEYKDAHFETLKFHLNLKLLEISGKKIEEIPNQIFENGTLVGVAIVNTSIYKIPNDIRKNNNLEGLIIKKNENLKINLDDISYFPKLAQLVLQSNNARSKIPYLGNLKNLQKLHLNQYSEAIPDGVFKLTELKELSLGSIKPKTGIVLSEELGNLINLESFAIWHSRFTELPKSINNLKKLKVLNLYNSWIKDLPSDLKDLKDLQKIYVGGADKKPYLNRNVERDIKKLKKSLPNLEIIYE